MGRDELIEECARLMCAARNGGSHLERDRRSVWKTLSEIERQELRYGVRAVLATVRKVLSEPDEGMVEAAFHGWHDGSAAREGDCFDADMPYADYKRIIDGRKFECAFKAMLAASPLGEIEDG